MLQTSTSTSIVALPLCAWSICRALRDCLPDLAWVASQVFKAQWNGAEAAVKILHSLFQGLAERLLR